MILDTESLHHADNLHHLEPVRIKDIFVPKHTIFPVASKICSQPEDEFKGRSITDHEECLEIEDESEDFETYEKCEKLEKASEEPLKEDCWSMSGGFLYRHHIHPWYNLFQPDETCPFPLKWLDVHRQTETNLEEQAEHVIEDYFDETEASERSLSNPWV